MNELLPRLFRSQAYRELGTARLFEQGIELAPDPDNRERLAHHAREERAHYAAVMDLWSSWARRAVADLEVSVEERLRAKPLPPAVRWLDLAMARFLFDRAGYRQLAEYDTCAFVPYRELTRRIVAEEKDHFAAGAGALTELAAAAEPRVAQETFERWLHPALLSFGRSNSAASRQAIALGLKRRDPAAVVQDFIDDIRPGIAKAGLTFPAAIAGIELPAAIRW